MFAEEQILKARFRRSGVPLLCYWHEGKWGHSWEIAVWGGKAAGKGRKEKGNEVIKWEPYSLVSGLIQGPTGSRSQGHKFQRVEKVRRCPQGKASLQSWFRFLHKLACQAGPRLALDYVSYYCRDQNSSCSLPHLIARRPLISRSPILPAKDTLSYESLCPWDFHSGIIPDGKLPLNLFLKQCFLSPK